MAITSPVAVDQRPKKRVTALFVDFRFGVNAGCFTSSISPTLSKRSAICAILVFRVPVELARREEATRRDDHLVQLVHHRGLANT